MRTKSIHEFSLGINVNLLGCVMLPTQPFDLFQDRAGLLEPEDLYFTKDPEKFWIRGDVAKEGGHVTLLYGLLELAWEQESVVRQVMSGWDRPEFVVAESIEVFPSPYLDEPYGCVVAKLHVSSALRDAHARLSYLPHVDTFPEYTPHVTLAYVKKEKAQDWADLLNLDSGLAFETMPDLDLGKRS